MPPIASACQVDGGRCGYASRHPRGSKGSGNHVQSPSPPQGIRDKASPSVQEIPIRTGRGARRIKKILGLARCGETPNMGPLQVDAPLLFHERRRTTSGSAMQTAHAEYGGLPPVCSEKGLAERLADDAHSRCRFRFLRCFAVKEVGQERGRSSNAGHRGKVRDKIRPRHGLTMLWPTSTTSS